MHNGFVTIEGEKMSKSLGNIILVRDLTNNYHGEAIRLALLSSHYRQGLDWNEKIIHQAKKLLTKIYQILDELKDVQEIESESLNIEPITTLMDDLNTPGLIAELHQIVKEYNTNKNIDKKKIKSKLLLIGSVLGIFEDKAFNKISDDLKEKVEVLINDRDIAKSQKNFELADKIRDELNELGIEIKDTSDGTSWNIKS